MTDPVPGVCYSGFRRGQSPINGAFPTREQVLEDLRLLADLGFRRLRMYEPNLHAETVLELIAAEGLPLAVMLGIDPAAEYHNPGCPWTPEPLAGERYAENAKRNDAQLGKLLELAGRYGKHMLALSVGNENRPSWGADLVSEERLCAFARRLKAGSGLPVGYCEGAWEWPGLAELAAELDFIGVHSYPQWNRVPLREAVGHMRRDLERVSAALPGRKLVVTEFGWATVSDSPQMLTREASEPSQAEHLKDALCWMRGADVPCFIFEAFDEPWKGGPSGSEPEKHWGLFREDRSGKTVVGEIKKWLLAL